MLSQSVDLAETVLQQATEKRPVDPQAFYYLADAAERRGHSDVARRALLDYRALEGDDPDGRHRAAFATRVADLSLRMGEAARPWPGISARLKPTAPTCRSSSRLRRRTCRQALEMPPSATVQKALEKDPSNKDALALARRIRSVTVPFSDPRGPGAHPQGN